MHTSGQKSTTSTVAEAFSRKAGIYDAFGEGHTNLQRMRAKVRRHVGRFLPSTADILEINAGTGEDAVYFAEQGHSVLATDISPGMLAAMRSKITGFALADRIETLDLSFTDLDRLAGRKFDLVFSNMGGLNCTPDLSAVTRHLPSLLKPGGLAIWVIMPRVCPWEWFALFKGDVRTAVRRLQRSSVYANVEGVLVPTYYFSARTAAAAFGPRFGRLGLESLSFFTPPADRRTFSQRYPSLYRILANLDERFSGAPLIRGWGDFFILTMQLK